MFNALDPDQDLHFVDPDLVLTVCKGYQQTTKEVARKELTEAFAHLCDIKVPESHMPVDITYIHYYKK